MSTLFLHRRERRIPVKSRLIGLIKYPPLEALAEVAEVGAEVVRHFFFNLRIRLIRLIILLSFSKEFKE